MTKDITADISSNISSILNQYKSPDKFLGYKAAAAFEKEICSVLRPVIDRRMVEEVGSNGSVVEGENIAFSDFKKIITFLESNILDDSATGLEYLYDALNKMLLITLLGVNEKERDKNLAKHWKWVKEHLLCENDFFLEFVLTIYTDEKYQAEMMEILWRTQW